MIWENTKLLLGLLYRPVSSMGRIVDEGHWLYAAVVVAALSMIFHAPRHVNIYNNYHRLRELANAIRARLNYSAYDEADFDVNSKH